MNRIPAFGVPPPPLTADVMYEWSLEAGRALGAAARGEPPEACEAGVAGATADARAAVALPADVVAIPWTVFVVIQ